MKTITLIIAFLLSVQLIAGENELCSSNTITQNIIQLISEAPPFSDFDLEGYVTIRLHIDGQHTIHLQSVESGNDLLVNHIYTTLENSILNCDCALPDTMYVLRLKYIQYS